MIFIIRYLLRAFTRYDNLRKIYISLVTEAKLFFSTAQIIPRYLRTHPGIRRHDADAHNFIYRVEEEGTGNSVSNRENK